MSGESWHIVEAQRDDGEAAIFRIRELAPRRELPTIFVVELPYKTAEMSKLPGAAAYRRLATFEESWLAKACAALGWVFVGVRIEDGSFFLYLYGDGEPGDMIARLAPFDGALGFYDDHDPAWGEYGTMSELLAQAKTLPRRDDGVGGTPRTERFRKATPASAKKAAKLAKPVKSKQPPTKVSKLKRAKPAKAKAKAKAKPKKRA